MFGPIGRLPHPPPPLDIPFSTIVNTSQNASCGANSESLLDAVIAFSLLVLPARVSAHYKLAA